MSVCTPKSFDLTGKVALITGASYGIGFAIATAMANCGATIVFNDIKQELVDKGLASYAEAGIKAHGYVCDVTDEDAVNAMVAKITEEVGHINILVNNAGIAWFGLLTDMTDEDWSSLLQTNLSSVFYCCRAAIPHMVSVKCGRIINISSMWGTAGASCEAAYSATKSGIHGLTKALAKELAPSNIQVNAIACGVIDTEMNACFSEEERQALADEIPLMRFGQPEEVAELAVFLADQRASFLTGKIITLDGGML